MKRQVRDVGKKLFSAKVVAGVLLPLLIIGGAAWLAWPRLSGFFASRTIAQCESPDRPAFQCYSDHLGKKTEARGPQAAFTELKALYERSDNVKSTCHQLTHVIGRAAGHTYQDVGKAYAEGDTFCWSGYYHGVLEAVAKNLGVDKLEASINDICLGLRQAGAYSFDHYNCVHGMGHGLMAIKNDELFESLTACDKLTDSWESSSCHGGVFMENVMANLNDYHDTKYLKPEEPLYPCTAVADKYKGQCYLMQTSYALQVNGYDFAKVFGLCATTGAHAPTCYQSLGRDASGSTTSDPARTWDLCQLGANDEAKSNCVVGAVKDFISYYHDDKPGLELCELTGTYAQACRDTAKSYYESFN